MYYNIPSAKLKCRHCGSEISPKDYDENNNAEEQKDYDVTIYTCRNCGAQLESPDDSIVSYCPYCGSEQVLEGRMGKSLRPASILPFSISKTKCKNQYMKSLSKLRYLPDEFKDPKYLDQFRGIYIPYWKYDVDMNGMTPLQIETRTTHGDRTTVRTYEGSAVPSKDPYSIEVDASSTFDDSIANHIAPFDDNDSVEFNTGYLAGFYADRPNVDPHLYDETVIDQSYKKYSSEIINSVNGSVFGADTGSVRQSTSATINKCEEHLLPVWFLTWKKKNRVAYSVMNGVTGEMMSDLPVNTGKYFGATLLVAAVLFAIFSLLISVTAPTALIFSVMITLIVMYLFYREMLQIRDRENHVFDIAYEGPSDDAMSADEKEKIRSKAARKNKIKKKNGRKPNAMGWGIMIYSIIIIIFSIASSLSTSGLFSGSYGGSTGQVRNIGLILVSSIAAVLALIILIRSLMLLKYVTEKKQLMTTILPFAAIALSFAVAISQTIEDYYFYIASVACLLAAVVISIALIKCYNILVTRPMPNFFDREGGKNDAED
ncbi:MAG: hypothetical protein ACOYJO_00595 [Eubacterium sp.]